MVDLDQGKLTTLAGRMGHSDHTPQVGSPIEGRRPQPTPFDRTGAEAQPRVLRLRLRSEVVAARLLGKLDVTLSRISNVGLAVQSQSNLTPARQALRRVATVPTPGEKRGRAYNAWKFSRVP